MSDLAAYTWREVSAGFVSCLTKPNALYERMEENVTALHLGLSWREYDSIQRSRSLRRVADGR